MVLMEKQLLFRLLLVWVVSFAVVGCAGDSEPSSKIQLNKGTETAIQQKMICLGDGITAGVGVAYEEGYTKVLAAKMKSEGFALQVVNAGIKGETASQANARIEWLLQQRFQVLLIAVGWDDYLAGIPFSETISAIEQMLQKVALASPDAQVIVVASPALGRENDEFALRELAVQYGALYCPSLVAGPGEAPAFWSTDGQYPNKAGQEEIADGLAEFLTQEL